MKKVLLFSISKNIGHFKAAKSIEVALNSIDPNCEILSIDAMQFFHPLASQLVDKMYYFSIKRAPFLWGGIYDSKRVKRTLTPIQQLIHYTNYEKLKKLVEQFKPDVIICTQAFPCGLTAHFKRTTGNSIPFIGVITDFWPHRFWFYKEVDCYTIANQWAKKRFHEFGISDEKVKVTGIPIHPNFEKPVNKHKACSNLGLNPEKEIIMLIGGDTGHGPIEEVVRIFDRSDIESQMVVICGNNEKLYERLKVIDFKHCIKVFGYTDEVYKIMSIADYIVSKSGGITTAEVLAKRKIMITLPSIPGQETFNMKYLLRAGMALRAKKPKDVVRMLKKITSDKKRSLRMLERIEKVSEPSSSLKIAKLAFELADE